MNSKSLRTMKYLLLCFVLYTILVLYSGLGSELIYRFKFSDWDIFGAHGRVTNINLYSNFYILGAVLFLIVAAILKIKESHK
jgi:hypothetical protein